MVDDREIERASELSRKTVYVFCDRDVPKAVSRKKDMEM